MVRIVEIEGKRYKLTELVDCEGQKELQECVKCPNHAGVEYSEVKPFPFLGRWETREKKRGRKVIKEEVFVPTQFFPLSLIPIAMFVHCSKSSFKAVSVSNVILENEEN